MAKTHLAESLLPLKPHWFHALLSLSDQEQHGYRIIDEELEESGQRPAAETDDSRRRYYSLTTLGRRVLAAEGQRLEDRVQVIHAKGGLTKREVGP